jgi:membrane protein
MKTSMWQAGKNAVTQWIEDEPFQLAAALSYYTLFSLAPLLVIAISIAGFAFGREAAQNQIVETLQGMIGQDSAQAVQDMVENASQQPKTGLISTVIGVVTLIFGAGGVVGQLQTSLNKIWGVTPKPGQGVWGFIRQRFVSYAMILALGFLLLVSLLVSAVLTGVTTWMSGLLGGAEFLGHALDLGVSFIFITVLFAMIFKFLPDVRIQWRDVWIGAAITSFLFTIGKFLIGLYLGTSAVSSTFGAAGSIITILLWVYYSSLILFLGAEFTQVYATQYGSGVAPTENAQPIAEGTQARKSPPPERRGGERGPRPRGDQTDRPGRRVGRSH